MALDDAGIPHILSINATTYKIEDNKGHVITTLDLSSLTTLTLPTGLIVTAALADASVTPVKTNIVQARTSTSDGLTTGIIADTTTHVTVTSADANNIITLPTPTPGRTLIIHGPATGFELRSTSPTTVAINGGTGADAESAIAANSTCYLVCVTATAWKGFFMDADGDLAKIEAAA